MQWNPKIWSQGSITAVSRPNSFLLLTSNSGLYGRLHREQVLISLGRESTLTKGSPKANFQRFNSVATEMSFFKEAFMVVISFLAWLCDADARSSAVYTSRSGLVDVDM